MLNLHSVGIKFLLSLPPPQYNQSFWIIHFETYRALFFTVQLSSYGIYFCVDYFRLAGWINGGCGYFVLKQWLIKSWRLAREQKTELLKYYDTL